VSYFTLKSVVFYGFREGRGSVDIDGVPSAKIERKKSLKLSFWPICDESKLLNNKNLDYLSNASQPLK